MAYEFATDEWVKALQEELNKSDAYRKAAEKWEGDFYFIVEEGQGIEEDIYLYLDLWHGEARQAYLEDDPASLKTAFELSAPLDTWKGVLNKKIDPIRGIMTRQLKLKGQHDEDHEIAKSSHRIGGKRGASRHNLAGVTQYSCTVRLNENESGLALGGGAARGLAHIWRAGGSSKRTTYLSTTYSRHQYGSHGGRRLLRRH